jgi:hypothetical protein
VKGESLSSDNQFWEKNGTIFSFKDLQWTIWPLSKAVAVRSVAPYAKLGLAQARLRRPGSCIIGSCQLLMIFSLPMVDNLEFGKRKQLKILISGPEPCIWRLRGKWERSDNIPVSPLFQPFNASGCSLDFNYCYSLSLPEKLISLAQLRYILDVAILSWGDHEGSAEACCLLKFITVGNEGTCILLV